MDTVLKCLNVEIPLSLHRARVVHANKYSEAHGGAFDFPVSSTLYTDVVFRLNENNEDFKTYIQNLDLPIYTDQDVTVICSGKSVLGFIDMQTNYYYYTVNNLSRTLGLGFPFLWVWIITILGGIAIYFANIELSFLWLILFFLSVYLVYLIQRWYLNRRIRTAIDAVLG
jgi:hypothetical protein